MPLILHQPTFAFAFIGISFILRPIMSAYHMHLITSMRYYHYNASSVEPVGNNRLFAASYMYGKWIHQP
ncbi:hypothetical protein L228DRAFT_251250 [Xylona heveae TC161]|uniref:Uncharacterized protein n=1 Tax=Xylona heveae (strain CBS 132557 / TC161) TaxID=1328760 RepID=A0A164ZIY5_XYLHT|nr:hypothetical protein L228DRAFT_251250 [Xylona heveae TC161]KZF19155.1 hypothetical protein L228DRAFT_251250 [Xylona heveae TC161]